MVTRKFHPGSEWLYFKIYTGVKTSDIVLTEAIKPFIQKLQNENLIKKWFFIRYNDPKPHLRLRLNMKNPDGYSYILKNMNALFDEYFTSGEISEIVIDTYKRELERYGENTIEDAEELFFKSSELILNFLEYDDEEKIMVSLFYIDCVLSKLKLSVEEKTDWIKSYDNAFKIEFDADKNLNRQIKNKYQQFYPQYHEFITSKEYEEIRDLITDNISETGVVIEKILKPEKEDSLNVKPEFFFQSVFHMHINRLFVSNQRLFEMIIYDYYLKILNK